MTKSFLKNHKKIAMRKCIVSNEILPKKVLVRIVKTKDGKIFVDHTNKANGRGVYIQPKIELVEKAKKNKILDKILHEKINDEIYQKIILAIKNYWD